jgi:hypothetical protein
MPKLWKLLREARMQPEYWGGFSTAKAFTGMRCSSLSARQLKTATAPKTTR